MSERSVTVLIAAYNAAAFLHRAVDSALCQTLPPLEILIVDDASTDDTLTVAGRMAERNPTVRVIALNQNGGPAEARNAGLAAARGEWIAILDADDAYLPDRLARLVDVGVAENTDGVADNFLWYDAIKAEAGQPGIALQPEREPIDLERFITHARPHGIEADWGLLKPMLRRRFLNDNRVRYDVASRHGEDFLFMVHILLAGARFVLVRAPGYLYTDRSSGMSRTKIDYDTMIAHTCRLLGDERMVGNAVLESALLGRSQALQRLAAEQKLKTCFRRRSYGAFLGLLLADRRNFHALLRVMLGKAKQWLR